MKQALVERLEGLNRLFYASAHGDDFDARRRAPWAGFARVIAQARRRDALAHVLDVGCGNGRFAAELRAETGVADYLGVDESPRLIEAARRRELGQRFRFEPLRLEPGEAPPGRSRDLVALMGVLHHVAGRTRRRALLEALVSSLRPGGLLALTLWRFDRSPRILGRALSGGAVARRLGDAAAGLEPGDHLLPWGAEGDAVRYCHLVDDDERQELLGGLQASSVERFTDDGGLNDYELLQKFG